MSQPPMGYPPMGQPPMGYPPPTGYAQPPPKSGPSVGCIIGIVVGGLTLVGVVIMVFIAIFGVRRYLAAAKAAEAKTTVSAIARAAVGAYERERDMPDGTVRHALCTSSGPYAPDHAPVPENGPPRGKKYMPDSSDYDTGTQQGGWKCLRFSMTQAQYYQYHYNQGDDYVVDRPDEPGEDDFEAAAIGDLDGDGTTSEFSSVGRIRGDRIKTDSSLFIKSEAE